MMLFAPFFQFYCTGETNSDNTNNNISNIFPKWELLLWVLVLVFDFVFCFFFLFSFPFSLFYVEEKKVNLWILVNFQRS